MEVCEADRTWFEGEAVAVLPDLYGTALRLTRDPTDAEDLVADAISRAWLHFGQLQDRASFRGWTFRILMNSFLSLRRARLAKPTEEPLVEDDGDAAEFSLFERLHQPFLLWWGNPEQQFLDRLLREELEAAIDKLPEPFRMVVVLADLQGLAYREIADALEIPVGTVRSRLSRGRSLLQLALWEHARDAGLVLPATPPHTPDA
jgi:RNA polymerase sigma-70 factor (ECF subfamily)